MAVDPNSVAPGKCYITATRHLRTVLEVTADRVRYAYGGSESGGVTQWRWQTKEKFANDVVEELSAAEVTAPEPPKSKREKKENGSREILSAKRR
jgi:hypothetical protein